MRPDNLLPQINAVHNAPVKPECIIQHPPGAGGQHQRVDPLVRNIFFEEFNPLSAAKDRAGFHGKTFFFGDFAELADIDGLSDPATFANIYTIFLIHG
jgi:hypothetical protein